MKTATDVLYKLGYLIVCSLMISCFDNPVSGSGPQKTPKMNGITFDGPGSPPINEEMLSSLEGTAVNWVSTTPEAFTYRNTLGVESFYRDGQWYGETIEGSMVVTKLARAKNYKVMMKPHIGFSYDLSNWEDVGSIDFAEKDSIINSIVNNTDELKSIEDPVAFQHALRNHKLLKEHYDEIDNYRKAQMEYISSQTNLTIGGWRGDFAPSDPEAWDKWESGYEAYILNLAHISDSLEVDLFCIGTELSVSAVKREKFWRQLIAKVKGIYDGPLTYSANWNNYENIRFWDELDYIGVSAYFPLSDLENPQKDDLLNAWNDYSSSLEKISKKYGRNIIFTEYGYKSVSYSAKEPWKEYVDYEANEVLQSNLYEALYQTFWEKDWFSGGFVWKWFYEGNGGEKSFSPQQKLAQQTMTEWYSKSVESK